MLNSLIRLVGGDPNRRDIEHYTGLVDEINGLEAEYQTLSDEALRGKTAEFRKRLEDGEALDDLLPDAFAAVREASRRTIGLRHYDVQLIGGMVLHLGSVAEMRTGEGKTLVATLPIYLNALDGLGAHLITVNDYLARRDARWMGSIYHALGMTVGVLQEASRTDNARKAFLFDPGRESNQEDADKLRMFDAFQRLGDSPQGSGIGLGLAVARGLARAQQGTLDAEDTPGGGLTMVLTLPAAAVGSAGGLPTVRTTP